MMQSKSKLFWNSVIDAVCLAIMYWLIMRHVDKSFTGDFWHDHFPGIALGLVMIELAISRYRLRIK